MNKAVFLDRDGTINEDIGYVYKIEDFKFIRGAIEGLQLLQKNGFKLIVITNQSGIARGYYSDSDFLKLNDDMNRILKENGIFFDGIYYCPHLKEACDCRKPKTSLFYKAMLEHNIDFSKSYAIGDNIRDLSICEVEDVKGILLSPNEDNQLKYIMKRDLLSAASYIVCDMKIR